MMAHYNVIFVSVLLCPHQNAWLLLYLVRLVTGPVRFSHSLLLLKSALTSGLYYIRSVPLFTQPSCFHSFLASVRNQSSFDHLLIFIFHQESVHTLTMTLSVCAVETSIIDYNIPLSFKNSVTTLIHHSPMAYQSICCQQFE